MNAANPRRRATDRYPLTDRIGWAFWRSVERSKRRVVPAMGFLCVGVFWGVFALVLFYGASR